LLLDETKLHPDVQLHFNLSFFSSSHVVVYAHEAEAEPAEI